MTSQKFKGLSKTFDFTFNYSTDEQRDAELDRWRQFDLKRVVIGDEVATTGQRHLQGKVTFARGYRYKQLHKLLPKYHVEKSLAAKDFNYCMKETIVLNIDNRQQGDRSDIKGAMELVRDKRPRIELMEAYPMMVARYEPFLRAYSAELQRYTGERTVVWVYGPTGAGKSHIGRETLPDAVFINFKGGFVNGYHGEAHVIIDDFRSSDVHFSELLKILDKYPYTVNVKGSTIPWNAKIIYITNPNPPTQAFMTSENKEQLLRRIKKIYSFPDESDECETFLRGLVHADASGTS